MQNKQNSLSTLFLFFSRTIHSSQRFAFERIKIKTLKKMIQKVNHSTIIESNHNYASIVDFKPLVDSYSSIKISSENQDTYRTNAINILHLNVNQENFLDQWMLRSKPEILFFEDYPPTLYSTHPIDSYSQSTLKTVKNFKFANFCKSTLKKKTNWIFQEVNPLQYKNTPISTNLIHLPNSEIQTSIEMFENLLKAAMDVPSEHHPIFHLHQFIQTIMKGVQDLREEGYFQVIKQMNSDKKVYLKVMSCLAATVAPSTRMYLPLLNYMYERHSDVENRQNSAYYYFIFFSLIKNYENPRLSCPSIFQLSCYKELRKIPITIVFPKQKVFFIEFFTTVQELLKQIVLFYNLDPQISYLLLIKNVLLESGNLLDKLNSYSKADENSPPQKYINFEGYRAVIVLKNMCEMNNTKRSVNIMYNYLVEQYRSGLFTLQPIEIAKIGGMILFSEVEDEEHFELAFERLIPKSKLEGKDDEKLKNYQKHILKQYFTFTGNRQQAKQQVLSILSHKKGFLTHFFHCYSHLEDEQPIKTWVGVRANKFILLEPKTGRIMKNFPFGMIRKWGESKKELCIELQEVGRYHFESRNTEVLGSVFRNYVEYNKKGLNDKK